MFMASKNNVILVAGATGQQGGAVARHLLAGGWAVRALTRDPAKAAAQQLAEAGAEIVQGNFADRATLDQALEGVYGLFGVQNFWEGGPEVEVQQGKLLADAAREANVQHIVYSSVGGAERNTNIPHFDSKWKIEEYSRQLNLPLTVLRPVFFMENFQTFMPPTEQDGVLTLSLALPPSRSLQLIAVDDIGAFAALAFDRPDDFLGQAVEIAGDELTMPQIAETWSKVSGKPIRFVEMPLEQLRQFNAESAIMFEWFTNAGYQADIPALRELYPPLKTFETWLQQTNIKQTV